MSFLSFGLPLVILSYLISQSSSLYFYRSANTTIAITVVNIVTVLVIILTVLYPLSPHFTLREDDILKNGVSNKNLYC